MATPRLLLLSNSTMLGTKYLEFAQSAINNFLTSAVKQILFIPFAGVSITWDEYVDKVKEGLPNYKIVSIHNTNDYREAVLNAEAICIGGGNTFFLLNELQKHNLIDTIRHRVLNDGVPYVGWSAGANVAAVNIATTNDMPVVWPVTDAALNLVSFNINPHYNEWKPKDYKGEGRDERLNECIQVRRNPIVALSEGTAILVENGKHVIIAPRFENCDQFVRCAKVWLPNKTNASQFQVKQICFDEDITAIIS